MISIKNVTKIYKSKKGKDTIALNNISLQFADKGLVFIVGKSGSGKSSLLNVIGGLDKYNSGEIIFDGKSFNEFKDKDYDYYRNSQVGFVFQDFNLIPEYNVYQNIELSLSLQKKHTSKSQIDKYLNIVGLENFGNRTIDELSGGQRQRVSIARALIKNSKIILADEPTGSLDLITSKQIFELLQQLSKYKLVIVVSHDIESAKLYADRIIQISDGKIIFDNNQNNNEKSQLEISQSNYNPISSSLTFRKSLKLAFKNLMKRKVKFIFTIILMVFAISFFGISKLLSKYDLEYSHSQVMVNAKENTVKINKNSASPDGTYQALNNFTVPFNESDIEYIENLLKMDTTKVYSLNENGKYINFNFNRQNISFNNNISYYSNALSRLYFIEYNSKNKQEVIGKYPTKSDEVLIHKTLADYIIYYGVELYNKTDKLEEYYKPTSYQQIIDEQKYIKLGDTNKIKIVGIIDDDLSEYEELKNIKYVEMNEKNEKLLDKFISIYGDKVDKVYVIKDFSKQINLLPNNIINQNDFLFSFVNNNSEKPINSTISLLTSNANITDGNIINNPKLLQNKEIIINQSYLDFISDNEFSNGLNNWISKHSNNLGIDNLTYEYINNYLIQNNIINSNLDIKVTDYSNKVNKTNPTIIEDVKIVGYSFDDTIYMSSDILEKYISDIKEITKLLIYSDNQKELEHIFTLIPINDNEFTTETIFSKNIINTTYLLDNISIIAFYCSIVFLIFSIILLINFINNTINDNKKQIGILRALGTCKKDVFKIFFLEGFLIGIISIIFSIIICYICYIVGNSIFMQQLFFEFKPIVFTLNLVITIIIYVLIVILISTFISTLKISSMKPIDAILDK